MRKYTEPYVAPFRDGFAIMVDNGVKDYRIGPNPLPTERAAEITLKILRRLGLNLNPNSRRRKRQNDAMQIDSRVQVWAENRIGAFSDVFNTERGR